MIEFKVKFHLWHYLNERIYSDKYQHITEVLVMKQKEYVLWCSAWVQLRHKSCFVRTTKGFACNYQKATSVARLSFRAFHLVSKEEMHCEQAFCQSLANTTHGSLCQKRRLCKQVMLLCSTNGKVDSP